MLLRIQHCRFGKPLDDGIEWPEDGEEAATLLRDQATSMAHDLADLAGAFIEPLEGVGEDLPQAQALAEQLGGEREEAVARVRDALREQLAVLVLMVLHRDGRLSEKGSGGAVPAEGAAECGADPLPA